MRKNRYYRGQGTCYIAELDTTTRKPKGFRTLGNTPEVNLSVDVEQAEHYESSTGFGLKDDVVETQQEGMINITLDNYSRENLAFAMFGKEPEIVESGSATEESHTAYPGYAIFLDNANVSNVVVTVDGETDPLVEGEDYTVDEKFGRIDVLEDGTAAEEDALLVDYDFQASEIIGAFTKFNTEKYVLFEGLNTAEDYSPVIIECYRVRFQPLDEWELIGDDYGSISLEGYLMADLTRSKDDIGGYFAKVRQAVRELA